MVVKKQKKEAGSLGGVALGAARSGQEELMHVLMLAGISPDHKGKDGKTLAHHAAEYAVQAGDADVLRMLVQYGANLGLRDNRGRSVLDILKANPRLESEVRAAWLGGSGHLGVRNSSVTDGKTPLGGRRRGKGGPTGGTGKTAKKAADGADVADVAGKLDELRKTKVLSLRRPEKTSFGQKTRGVRNLKSREETSGAEENEPPRTGEHDFGTAR